MTLTPEALNRYHNRNGLRQRGRPDVLKSDTAQSIDTTLSAGTGYVPENSIESLEFGLTPVEKSSIESDINAKKPIGDTPAYRKFLHAVFPDKEPIFPYLADYDDAVIVVSKVSELFGKMVRLPHQDEAKESLKNNKHLTGCLFVNTYLIWNAGDVGFAWLSSKTIGERALCTGRDRDGSSYSSMSDRRNGYSVIPVWG